MYALNVSQEWKLLCRSLISVLDNFRLGLLMEDCHVCCEEDQSTSNQSIMDGQDVQEGKF